MNKILAKEYSINDILNKKKYFVDDYQREYRWGKRNIDDLLNDLWSKFNDSFMIGDRVEIVKTYNSYFLGSILISEKDNNSYLVDGQQRLTSLSLIIIYLYIHLKEWGLLEEIDDFGQLIYSLSYGKKTFNIQVPDREKCMEALFNNQYKEFTNASENTSSYNLLERYRDIEEFFQDVGLSPENILHFSYWLKDNVFLVSITTSSDDEAYTIFETMNDRGLSLDNTEMLKGYLIANVSENNRSRLNEIWKDIIIKLKSIGKEEDSIFFKNWIRAKYANTSRTKKANGGYTSEDFERVGNAYHKWIKENKNEIGLKYKEDFENFIEMNLKKFSEVYLRIKELETKLDLDFKEVYCNANQDFTLQSMLILSAIELSDSNEIIDKKIKMVSTFIDIFIVRSIVNYKLLGYSGVVYRIFNYVKKIRENSKDLNTLRECLTDLLDNLSDKFEGLMEYHLNKQNRRRIHYFLARITSYVEEASGHSSRIDSYLNKAKGKDFEIEHIIASNFKDYSNSFDSEEDFQVTRSSIGNLVLLQNGTNQSLGDKHFREKKIRYKGENILLQSLCEETYISNPNFTNFIKNNNLNFHSVEDFNKKEVKERTELYCKLAEKIWNANNL
ncbi:DUF262 domain-containing HNH endonuclease family protein [uncultured Fusobacterium sp.]|uniref:DUF262 domain-containing HNH endonuclease family protein n=1 Tax=uncultured Fusobacterium sp. TaxID=159267 RepID=UPI0027DBD97A|nr:DUF262 domain-containing HNH endonuclease family protein [uncultured Fusobacterium sp.]